MRDYKMIGRARWVLKAGPSGTIPRNTRPNLPGKPILLHIWGKPHRVAVNSDNWAWILSLTIFVILGKILNLSRIKMRKLSSQQLLLNTYKLVNNSSPQCFLWTKTNKAKSSKQVASASLLLPNSLMNPFRWHNVNHKSHQGPCCKGA